MSEVRKKTVLKIPNPKLAKQVREFLRMAGLWHLWISGFAEIAKPLYEAMAGGQDFIWMEERQRAFDALKC